MDGIALADGELPRDIVERYRLQRLVHERGGERELRFLRHAREALLPVWYGGEWRIVPWGSRSGRLPRCGLTWLHTVEAGEWGPYGAEPVEIPATAGWQNGVWFRIHRGVQGVIVQTSAEVAAYLLVEPSSYYFRVMTRSEQMPVLIGERI